MMSGFRNFKNNLKRAVRLLNLKEKTMVDDTENHTIRLLQEMRSQMSEMQAEMRQGFKNVNARIDDTNARIDDTNIRIDGLTHIVTILAGNIYQHDERIQKLEQQSKASG